MVYIMHPKLVKVLIKRFTKRLKIEKLHKEARLHVAKYKLFARKEKQ